MFDVIWEQVKRWRVQAEECRDQADQSDNPMARATFLRTAQTYERSANYLERAAEQATRRLQASIANPSQS